MTERRKVLVVMGWNGLLRSAGPVAVALTREAAEVAKKHSEWICDTQEVIECDLWEEADALPQPKEA